VKKSFKKIGIYSLISKNASIINFCFLIIISFVSLNDVFAQSAPDSPVLEQVINVRNDRFTANWDSSATATGYYLDVATDISFTSFVSDFNNYDLGQTLRFTVTGLTDNTQYYYRIRAYNSIGTSASTATASVITGPAVPTSRAATSITQINFVANWDSVAAASNYYLDIAKDSLFNNYVDNYSNRNVGTHNFHTVDSALTSNTIYYYRVRASNTNGISNSSKIKMVSTLPLAPSVPLNFAVTNVQVGKVLLSWVNNSNSEIGFNIERRTSGQGDFVQIDTAAAGATSYRDNTVAENQTYDYRIKAYNKYFQSNYTEIVSITTLYYDVSAPTNLSASTTQVGKIVLKWTDNSFNEIGFNIERKTASSTNYVALDRVSSNTTTYTDSKVSSNVTYNYRISAYNLNTISNYSNVVTVTSLTSALNAPTNLTAGAPSAGWVALSWTDNTTNETGFKIERKLSTETSFTSIGTAVKDAITYWDNTILPNKSYDYRIKAYNDTQESDYSNIATITTKTSGISRIGIPVEYSLEQNFPNPFNPSTIIRFSLPKTSFVKLTIYNMLGEVVMSVINEEMSPGYYYQELNAINLSSGIYIYSLNTKEFSQTKKMILLK
jgi:hypothetical protein